MGLVQEECLMLRGWCRMSVAPRRNTLRGWSRPHLSLIDSRETVDFSIHRIRINLIRIALSPQAGKTIDISKEMQSFIKVMHYSHVSKYSFQWSKHQYTTTMFSFTIDQFLKQRVAWSMNSACWMEEIRRPGFDCCTRTLIQLAPLTTREWEAANRLKDGFRFRENAAKVLKTFSTLRLSNKGIWRVA